MKLIYDIIPPQKKTSCIVPGGMTRTSRGVFRIFLSFQKQLFAFGAVFFIVLANIQGFIAFEAHGVDVKATIAGIDAPRLNNVPGEYVGSTETTLHGDDPDATYIFYTVTPGTDTESAPSPVCGDLLGGAKDVGPIHITQTSVMKAIACDGSDSQAHGSKIAVGIYRIIEPPPVAVSSTEQESSIESSESEDAQTEIAPSEERIDNNDENMDKQDQGISNGGTTDASSESVAETPATEPGSDSHPASESSEEISEPLPFLPDSQSVEQFPPPTTPDIQAPASEVTEETQ